MPIRMQDPEQMTLEQMRTLVDSSQTVRFSIEGREAFYNLVSRVLKHHGFARLSREHKGIVRRFLVKVTGRSRAQITRLIGQWMQSRSIPANLPLRRRFPSRYTAQDCARLAEVDLAHDGLSGPAVRRILRREYEVFGKQEYQRLANISVSHLYNLRRSKAYRKIRVQVQSTRASKVSIAQRRKPEPRGRPGYLRVDTVHQGHHDGQPGIYHINAVDTVTQWQVVGCVETISERHLLPVLEAMLHQMPFLTRGFHCDWVRVSTIPVLVRSQVRVSIMLVARLGVHQLSGGWTVGETESGVHQITGLSDHRQRAGGRQERSRNPQTHRFWPDPVPVCRRFPKVLHGSFESLPELPQAVRICDGNAAGAWPAQAHLPGR